MRVVVVDDSPTVRVMLTRAFTASGAIEVVGTAADGIDAIEIISNLRPDVVTLDVEMPRLDGLGTLRRLMAECPTRVVMVSSKTGEGADATIRALELGAVDFIEKPDLAGLRGAASTRLVQKILDAAHTRLGHQQPAAPRPRIAEDSRAGWRRRVVVIASSTGGPQALLRVMSQLPADFPVPIVIVQHMPAGFTASLARRLDELGPLPVKEAAPGDQIAAGRALLAPGGVHLEFDRTGRAVLTEAPLEGGVRPAANITMQSIAVMPASEPLAVILTGMGRDGLRGAGLIQAAGGTVIAEHESTCIVYGMPRAVIDAGLADEVVPLDEMATAIVRHTSYAQRIGGAHR